ncbi:hypothetical protein LCGC14_0432840 [marine sediment metagenome]|uniref:Bacteriophage Mu GpT domain-containing protein n=1 Tax=marine sediment metagenome TaxID=412755 RepID=A0A0F9STW9_9ZZZZ
MSLTDVAIQQFLDQFKIQYQATKRKLDGTFTDYRGLEGDAFKIPVLEEIQMQNRGAYNSVIASQIPDNAFKIITFDDFITRLPIDDFEKFQTNANVRSAYSMLAVSALNRKQDQIGINALNASTTTNAVAVGTTNLTVDKIRDAAELLDIQNVPPEDRFWAANASQKKSLLNETETTSSDYNTVKTLVQGQIDSFYGFKFIWFGNMIEGGLPKTNDNRLNFAWHMGSIAYGYKMNPTVVVERVPAEQNWNIFPKTSLGGNEVLPKGIVKITCDETK